MPSTGGRLGHIGVKQGKILAPMELTDQLAGGEGDLMHKLHGHLGGDTRLNTEQRGHRGFGAQR